MLPTMSNRSYSEFFTSGFHSMTNSKRRVSAVVSPSIMTLDDFVDMTIQKKRPRSFIGFPNRASRPSSLALSPTQSISSKASSYEPRTRRSSIIAFSSWLFDRRKSNRSDNYLSFSRSPPKNKRELFGPPEVKDVRIAAGRPYSPTCFSTSSENFSLFQQIDPFSSSPDSKSFFIDLADSPSPVSPTWLTAKRESFLSMSGSSERSFMNLRIPRRERPSSIHTMPLPPREHQSSYWSASKHPSDYSFGSWAVEEESRVPTPEPRVGLEEWSDPAQHIDWRQFHLEVLCQGSA